MGDRPKRQPCLVWPWPLETAMGRTADHADHRIQELANAPLVRQTHPMGACDECRKRRPIREICAICGSHSRIEVAGFEITDRRFIDLDSGANADGGRAA